MGVRPLRLDLWLPPLVLMGVIFALSAQPSLDSGLGVIDDVGRKLIHFGEYALLCFLWWRALASVTSPRRAAVLAFLITSGYAVTDEYHQTFVDGRHGTALDWLIDSAGAAVVALRLGARERNVHVESPNHHRLDRRLGRDGNPELAAEGDDQLLDVIHRRR